MMARDRIINRRQNDELRMHLLGGGTLVSQAIVAFNLPKLCRLLEQLAKYEGFCATTDPSGEHAFGVFEFEGTKIVFKIESDILSSQLVSSGGTLMPTERILTIMLAEEYFAVAANLHDRR